MFLIGFATGGNGRIALLQVVIGTAEEVPAGSWWPLARPSGPNVWHTQRSLCVKVWGNDFERGWPLVRKTKNSLQLQIFKCILKTNEFPDLAWALETLKKKRYNLEIYRSTQTYPKRLQDSTAWDSPQRCQCYSSVDPGAEVCCSWLAMLGFQLTLKSICVKIWRIISRKWRCVLFIKKKNVWNQHLVSCLYCLSFLMHLLQLVVVSCQVCLKVASRHRRNIQPWWLKRFKGQPQGQKSCPKKMETQKLKRNTHAFSN